MTTLDDIQQAVEWAKVCPHCKVSHCKAHDCGEHATADQITVCRLRNECVDLRGGLELAESRISELEAALGRAEAVVALYRKGYEARGKILVAYRTGGQPSEKALTDAAIVAEKLGLIPGGKTNG